MVAIFSEITDHGPLSLDNDGWDQDTSLGIEWKYQMVPVNGDRFIMAKPTQEMILFSSDPSIAKVSCPLQDASSTANRIVLKPQSGIGAFAVQIHGASEGRTFIHISVPGAKISDSVEVSVKSTLRKTYRMWRLKDIARETARTDAQVIAAMNKVTTVYKNQANVDLAAIGSVGTLIVKSDLKNPIASPNVLLSRLSVLISFKVAGSADFDVVSTWDLGPDLLGLTVPLNMGISMIEDYAPGNELQEATTFAHELCHAFGVWTHSTRDGKLMGPGDSFRMTRSDMDAVNSSGSWPAMID